MTPTDGIASPSKAWWRRLRPWKDSSPWPRLILVAGLVLMACTWTTFVAVRLKATYDMEYQLLVQQAEFAEIRKAFRADDAGLEARLRDLEAAVFAEIRPKIAETPKVIRPRPETWQIQRDLDIQRRILQLERWRLEMGKQ